MSFANKYWNVRVRIFENLSPIETVLVGDTDADLAPDAPGELVVPGLAQALSAAASQIDAFCDLAGLSDRNGCDDAFCRSRAPSLRVTLADSGQAKRRWPFTAKASQYILRYFVAEVALHRHGTDPHKSEVRMRVRPYSSLPSTSKPLRDPPSADGVRWDAARDMPNLGAWGGPVTAPKDESE